MMRTAFQYLSILFLMICLGGWPNAASAEYDPCLGLAEVSEDQTVLRWNLLNIFRESPPDPPAAEGGDRPYLVTIRAGRFANVSCNGAGYEWQEMYPIGIALRKIADLSLDDWNDEGLPILVETEYGHRKIVSTRNVQQMVANATYIFADSFAKSMICRAADACPGNAEDICDDGRCRYDISAKFGYAVAASQDETVAAAVDAYSKLRADRLVLRSIRLTEEELAKAQADICEPFAVKAYIRGGELTQPRDSFLTLCSRREAYGASEDGYAPLKILSLESVEGAFDRVLEGSFHRRFGEGPSTDESILAALGNVRLSATKPCGVELEDTSALSFAGGLSAKANAGILEVNLGADREFGSTITETIPADDFLLFSTYFINPLSNATGEEDDDDLWLFRIVFRAECVNGTPRASTSIKIFYDRLGAGAIEISADGELFETYSQAWSEFSYVSSTDPAFLMEGQFWQIVDHIGYFIWRDTLREYFYRVPGTNALISKYPVEDRPFIRDFFVHLMLSAAYHHLNPEDY